MCGPRKKHEKHGTIRIYLRNLSEPVPAGTKIKHIATNLWIKASKLSLCCGHPGQAGC